MSIMSATRQREEHGILLKQVRDNHRGQKHSNLTDFMRDARYEPVFGSLLTSCCCTPNKDLESLLGTCMS